MIVVINFGAQYCHLIARRIRELGVHSEIVPHTVTPEELVLMNPDGIIFSGGPSSVYERGAPLINKSIYKLDIPILGICYGMQLMAKHYGKVVAAKKKEFGAAIISVKQSTLLKGLKQKNNVWMSHGDNVKKFSKNFKTVATSKNCPIAAVENHKEQRYGVQFHPEVVHTENGMKVLSNFLFKICKADKDWSMSSQKKDILTTIKQTVGNDSVIMGLSGGVDSTVAATLLHNVIGKRLHCVFIDHGLIRKNEAKSVMARYKKHLKFKNLYLVDASKLFLSRLKGVQDPEKKRKIIGHTFIEVFEKKVKEIEKKHPSISFLGQGTIYPDRIESGEPSKKSSVIKSHHNLSLPEKMKLKVIEPLKELYKDEVRQLGRQLKVPEELIGRHPFPGPGLAIRVVGEITPKRLQILREADAVYMEELRTSGYYNKIWQAFAALLPVKAVGVKGDARAYEYIITLRAVTSIDAMTADWAKLPNDLLEKISNRILNEVPGVARVLYDVSQKPPATIEYE